MKRKSIISILFIALGLGMFTSSCEDMLTADLERHQDTPAQDTLYTYWGIVKSLQNVAERYVILGECRGDMVNGTQYVSDSIHSICDFDHSKAYDGACRYLKARDYYHVINSCNSYLAYADTFKTTGTNQKYMLKEYAMVEAVRAWVYLQLVQVYGEVPFYTTPLLTTEAMDAFLNNPSSAKANRNNLPDLLGPKLEKVKDVPMPDYGWYGSPDKVIYSTKCMIPVNLILADLYLYRGASQSDFVKAAEHYYEYIDEEEAMIYGGDYYGNMRMGNTDEYEYMYNGQGIFNSTGKTSSISEAISVIPSNKNKLTGNVLRGINTLFGFTPSIQVADTANSANIYLTVNFEKELTASKLWENLNKAQKFEYYVGEAKNLNELTPTVEEKAGDARQYWVQDVSYSESQQGKFIMKQNPGGAFSTAYPVIYRRTTVWLRYAEALNRAGFPGYAFAILKNGICNAQGWFADDVKDFEFAEYEYFELGDKDTIIVPREDLVAAGLELDSIPVIETATNRQHPANTVVCNHISMEETKAAALAPYMNYQKYAFTPNYGNTVMYKRTAASMNLSTTNYNSVLKSVAAGIHSRGCGKLKYDERNSVYNYEDMVKAANPNVTDVYDVAQQDEVIEAVENLIIDELALETCFEGNRFFDLSRVAHRRNNPAFLADRVAKRSGEIDAALHARLMNPSNWYFRLPNY